MNIREILNAIFVCFGQAADGRRSRKICRKSNAHWYPMPWTWDGTLERIHHALCVAVREQEGREASPTAAIIDSQSAKAAQKGLRSTRKATTRAKRVTAARGIS